MRIPDVNDEEMGRCCADFYTHPLVVKLLDGIFHPGGLALSNLMAERMQLDAGLKVLDIACGDGMTATYLAKKFRCYVTGMDAGPIMVELARQRARDIGVSDSTEFIIGLATKIPFPVSHFDAAYSECAVCTFADKEQSVKEAARVVKTSGLLGINDIVLHDHDLLDDELKGLFGQVACISGALSPEGYRQLFELGGFKLTESSDHSVLLEQMVEKAMGRVRIMTGIEESLSTATIDDVARVIGKIQDQVQTGNLGYELFIFERSVL